MDIFLSLQRLPTRKARVKRNRYKSGLEALAKGAYPFGNPRSGVYRQSERSLKGALFLEWRE